MKVKIIVTEENDQILWSFYNDLELDVKITKRRVGVILEEILGQYPKYTTDQFNNKYYEGLVINLATGKILKWEYFIRIPPFIN